MVERLERSRITRYLACCFLLIGSTRLGASGNEEHQLVKKLWGLSDSTAHVGHVYHYHIPSDAFSGNIKQFKAYETSRTHLPRWLYLNETLSTIEGVPTWRDIGQVYITVEAIGDASSAQDIFSLDVLPLQLGAGKVTFLKNAHKAGLEHQCEKSDDRTMLSVLIDADFHSMEAGQRVQLANVMSKHLELPIDELQLTPLEFGERAFDGNTIMAGPGNARSNLKPGLILQWQVGCKKTSLDQEKEALVSSIEKSARDGSLAKVLGYPVVGWHLASVPPPGNQLKKKRQAFYPQATPVPELQPTKRPTFTHTVTESFPEDNIHEEGGGLVDEYDEGPVPDHRIIPTMASPSFTYSTASHRHRHQHELGGRTRPGSHQNPNQLQPKHPDSYLTASPSYRGYPAVVNTPTPTPVAHLPIYPTKPSYVDLDETETLSSTSQSHVITEPLPTDHTFVSPPPETTDIYPTRVPEVVPTTSSSSVPLQNFKPVMKTRIQKQVFVAGKISRFQVPASTFFDFEDGETPSLKLILTNADGTALQSSSWIQFNSNKQEIYAIPLEENIGKWDFSLEAMDRDGGSVRTTLEIHVRQHAASRAVHHEFVMNIKYDKWRFASNIDWQIKLAEHLAAFFGDSSDQNIVVRSISNDPITFTWTNDSLPAHPCPHEQIQELLDAMVANREGASSKHLRKAVGPEFRVVRTTVNLLGHCKAKIPPTSTTLTNNKPVVRNQIDHINATVGELLHFKVPEDTFYDEEDGNVRNLKLVFLTIDGGSIPHSSWIQFDSATQEFNGLPMLEDIGSRQYQLVAIDKEGSNANDALVIEVHKRPETRPPSVEFSIRIDHDFHSFNNDLTKKVMVLDKLAHLYGDPDPRYLVVKSINHGSVLFTWTNNTLPSEPCPKEQIGQLVKVMFNNNGTVSRRLLETFQPEFNITAAEVIPFGICLADITPTSISVGPTSTTGTEHATSDDDIYITTIIPAAIIAAMLLIAAIIACILYRKKRKGKMTMEDSSTFVNKGIPIIFADELEDKPDPAKSPVIMKEEKPPLPPPDYHHRSSRGGSPSTTPVGGRRRAAPPEPQHRYMEMASEPLMENTPPYQPPPPLTASRDSRLNRPKHTPNYRLPPPYVPP